MFAYSECYLLLRLVLVMVSHRSELFKREDICQCAAYIVTTIGSHEKKKSSSHLNHDLVLVEPLSALVVLSPGHMPPSVAVCEGIIQLVACKFHQS